MKHDYDAWMLNLWRITGTDPICSPVPDDEAATEIVEYVPFPPLFPRHIHKRD